MDRVDVSLIVPVYNTEMFLDKCIQSLLNQSFKSFEIILVNDGSTDNSQKICDKYAEKYANIRSYSTCNGGLSSARNYGIDRANGEFIMFLDSDDWFEENMLSEMMRAFFRNNSDVVIQGFQVDFESDGSTYYEVFERDMSFQEQNLYEGILNAEQKGLFNSSCNKMYKTNIIKEYKIYFEEGQEPAEDLLFNCNYFKHVKKFSCIQNAGYHYVKRNVQTLTVKYMPNYEKRILHFVEARKDMYNKINMPKDIAKKLCDNSMASYTLTAISNIYRVSSPLKFQDRNKVIQYIFDQNKIVSGVLLAEYTNLFLKILKCTIKIRKVLFTNILFTVLYGCRYRFEKIYIKLRKKILYSKGGET